jgi:circadian clock protein KaiB
LDPIVTATHSQLSGGADQYVLRLYVTGTTRLSMRAFETTREICDTYLMGRHELEVVDLYEFPEAAAREQIVAIPTLVRVLPGPPRRILGDLSDRERILAVLGLALRGEVTS